MAEKAVVRDTSVAIITAAGTGSRMGPGVKKELRLIDGIPVLRACINAFLKSGCFSHILITYNPDRKSEMEAALCDISDAIMWVKGGITRQGSVFSALTELERYAPRLVLIHDGARPWVTPALIQSVVAGAEAHGACIPVVPLIDAPKRIDASGHVLEHINKSALANAQTPQGFRYEEILAAHRVARENGKDYSDDAEAYHDAIGRVYTVQGDPANRKITYGNDL